MDNNIDPNNAAKNPVTIKPETITETSQNSKAFIIKVNKPNVSKFIGIVKSINIGFMKIFMMPITKAAHNAGIKPVRLTPGTTQAINSKDRAKSIHLIIISSIALNLFLITKI